MKVLYDHQMFSIQKFGGITRYFCELIKNKPEGERFALSLLSSDNHYLQEERSFFRKPNFLPDRPFIGKHAIREKLRQLNQVYSRYRIGRNDFDLLHPTFYDEYFFQVLKKPYVITVHDLIVFKYREEAYRAEAIIPVMEKVIDKATRIIAISEHTRKDLIEILKADPAKIDVIYHGYTPVAERKLSGRFGNYLLFVGHRGAYKNFATFAEAVSALLLREPELKLICVGRPFSREENELLAGLKISNKVTAMSVDDDTLNELYANARVFVFPSRYEGFGMPILEAFANDCPVCLSDASCFPEIAGEAGMFFDPTSRESIREAVEKILYDDHLAESLRSAGRARLRAFSWERTARATWATYAKAV